MVNRPGDDIPWGQFRRVDQTRHKALARWASLSSAKPFAPQGLGYQGKAFGLGVREAGGVELRWNSMVGPPGNPPASAMAIRRAEAPSVPGCLYYR